MLFIIIIIVTVIITIINESKRPLKNYTYLTLYCSSSSQG